jgi:hypothetical protein
MLFRTIHGSRLYGMGHEKSDYDWYTVVSKVNNNRAKYSTHKIVGSQDSVVVDFGTWIRYCEMGVPQALEAMFSTIPEHDEIQAFREGFVAGTETHARYLRTISSFVAQQDYKKKRHALRLALNFVDLAATGRFNPTLSEDQIAFISEVAHRDTDKVYAVARSLADGVDMPNRPW